MSARLDLLVSHLTAVSGDGKRSADLGPKWSNFAQLGSCLPRRQHYPATIGEVVGLVKSIYAKKEQCRVAGAGKSPNASTFTTQHLIHTTKLARIISVDIDKATITCEGGVLLGDVYKNLDSHGLMLRCVPSILDMTIAGALGTGAHSSGINTPSMSSFVTALTIVDGTGTLREFSKAESPFELSLAACHLGVLGVVISVTLQAEKKAMWRVSHQPITIKKVEQVMAQRVMMSDFYRVLWTPHTNMCYESVGRVVGPADEAFDIQSLAPSLRSVAAYQPHSGGSSTAATEPTGESSSRGQLQQQPSRQQGSRQSGGDVILAAVRSLGGAELATTDYEQWQEHQKMFFNRLSHLLRSPGLRHEVLEAALATTNIYPDLQPLVNAAYQKVFLNNTEEVYGTVTECFAMDCLLKQWACEWAVDAEKAPQVLRMVRGLIKSERLRVHFPVEFRFGLEDDAKMSPASGRKTCWVGIVMYRPYLRDARDTKKYYDSFSREMTKLGGRPHWAKYFNWRYNDVLKAYGSNWLEFLDFRAKMDPDNIFVNDWFQRLMTNH